MTLLVVVKNTFSRWNLPRLEAKRWQIASLFDRVGIRIDRNGEKYQRRQRNRVCSENVRPERRALSFELNPVDETWWLASVCASPRWVPPSASRGWVQLIRRHFQMCSLRINLKMLLIEFISFKKKNVEWLEKPKQIITSMFFFSSKHSCFFFFIYERILVIWWLIISFCFNTYWPAGWFSMLHVASTSSLFLKRNIFFIFFWGGGGSRVDQRVRISPQWCLMTWGYQRKRMRRAADHDSSGAKHEKVKSSPTD